MDFSKLCLTCLNENEKEPVLLNEELYKFLEEDLSIISLPRYHEQMIMPDTVCFSCYRSIMDFRKFYMRCRNSEIFFRQQIDKCEEDKQDFMDNETVSQMDWQIEATSSNDTDTLKREIATRLFVCKLCDKEFDRKADLRAHEITHPGLRPFDCEVCGDSFKQRAALNTHLALHYGKTVPCTMCDKKFARKGLLKQHIQKHHIKNSFQCEICGEGFRLHHLFLSHQKIHSGTKDSVCKFCFKSFYSRTRLLEHISSCHRHYCCNLCEKSYNKLDRMKSHLRKIHQLSEITDQHYIRKIENEK